MAARKKKRGTGKKKKTTRRKTRTAARKPARPRMPKGMPPGLNTRVSASIVVGIGWVIFVLLFLAFYTTGLSAVQCLFVILVSILIVAALLGSMWARWGMNVGYRWGRRYGKDWEKRHKRW